MRIEDAHVVIVGGGLYGLTMAERVASLGRRVCIVERRPVIGGNAADYVDEQTGILVHSYGSHIFHTSNQRVFDYVSRFAQLNSFRFRAFAQHAGQTYSLPINMATITAFYGRSMSPMQARALIAQEATGGSGREDSLEEWAISRIGRPLYEAFIRGYTAKQWQTDPRELPADIIARLPVRYTFNGDYFDDAYQGIPLGGYSAWFARMVDHPLIGVHLGVDFFEIKDRIRPDQLVVYTGPIDRYFDYEEGILGWRTLDFEVETLATADFQGTAMMNYPDSDVAFTRIHEFKHFHPERQAYRCNRTVIAREFSRWAEPTDEPYYPVRAASDLQRLCAYRERAAREPSTVFGGRLGSYQYLDMHMAIGAALTCFESTVLPWLEAAR